MVKIRTRVVEGGAPVFVEAIIEDGEWTTSNADLRESLDLLFLPPGYYPYPDYSLAEIAIENLGGEIIDAPPIPPSTGNIDEGPSQSERSKDED